MNRPGRCLGAGPCSTIRRMLMYPHIDPVALRLGPLAIHWYGLTYLAAFGLFLLLALRRLHHEPFASVKGPGAWSRKDVEDMLFLGVMGTVIGGRLGYCLFYKPAYYASHPFVPVIDTPPSTKHVAGTNYCTVHPSVNLETGTVVITTALDNLGKGAAGAVVQCLNVMRGFHERGV